jgi:aminomethyltransferase
METPHGQVTPLYDFHKQNGAKFVNFAGWQMPIQYTSILEEHKATREAAGLFDVSHMGEFLISGTGATNYMDRLLTNDLTCVKHGQALYSPACMEDGGVIDDLILYKFSEDKIFLCCNASNTAKVEDWLNKHLLETPCDVTNQSTDYAQIALQGPQAKHIMDQFRPGTSSEVKRFNFLQTDLLDAPSIISRTGYTGEDGFEIYCPPEIAHQLAESFQQIGHPLGLRPVGLGARDSLRLEAGYPLYGHEISETRSPIVGGIGWTVKFDKNNDFIGKTSLLTQKDSSETPRTIHFITQDKRIAREGSPVFAEGRQVGEVISGSYSPMIHRGIGSAVVEPGIPEKTSWSVEIRNREIAIEPSTPPLHTSTSISN